MKLKYLIGWSSALCLSAIIAQAQETNEVDKLDQRLKQIQESFEKQQREMRENFERLIREQQAQIESLKKQLANIPTNAVAGPPTNAAPAVAVTPEQLKELNTKVDQVVEAQKQVRPSAFNPSIGFVGETIFSYSSQGSDQTGSERPGGFDVIPAFGGVEHRGLGGPVCQRLRGDQRLGGFPDGRGECRASRRRPCRRPRCRGTWN